MANNRAICITGGTGLFGKGLLETAPHGCQIVSLHKRPYPVHDSRATHIALDVGDRDQVRALFEKYEFEAVVHAAGIAAVDYVQSHAAESLESNLIGTVNVASACLATGCHMVYVSTNAVFDGVAAPYRESDPVSPINRYGQIKAECERVVSLMLEQYTLVRPILMYGWNAPMNRLNPATWVMGKLLKKEPVHMVTDVYENPLYNRQCGEAVWEVLRKKCRGTIHLAGADVVNRYEFARTLAEVFELDASLIEPVESAFFSSIAPRPKNTSFVTERMEKELGLKPLRVREGLRLMRAQMEPRDRDALFRP